MVKQKKLMRLDLQFFGDGGDSAATAETTVETAATATTDTATDTKQDGKTLTDEALEKIIQSRVDKVTAKLGKEKADAVAALEQLKKDKMSADELQKYELEQERKALADQKKELVDKANRLTAINELTKVELYDGSEHSAALLDMIVNGAKEEADIAKSVTAVKSVIDKIVSAKVTETFKANGRTPNGESKGGEETNNIAAELGKKAAETAKQSNEILNHYYRRNK